MEHHQSRQPYELDNQPEQPSTPAGAAPEQQRTREQVIRQRIEQAIGRAALAGDYSGIRSPAEYTHAIRHTLTYNTLGALQAMKPGEEVNIMSMYQSLNPDTPLHQFTTMVAYLEGAGFVSLDMDQASVSLIHAFRTPSSANASIGATASVY